MKSPAVLLEVPTAARRDEFIAAVRRSRVLHRPWVQPPATPAAFDRWLARALGPNRRSYLICHRESGALAGVVNVSEIVRGPLRSAYLGDYAFARWHGQGLMTAGLARPRASSRFPSRRIFATLPEDRAPLARPRALCAARRGLAQALKRNGSMAPPLFRRRRFRRGLFR